MKFDFVLTAEQQALVEWNLDLVARTISRYIQTNESVCGMGYDDLYQEGAMALCGAAATYDGVSATFRTYATAFIRNHLIDCCRAATSRQRHISNKTIPPYDADDGEPPPLWEPSGSDGTDALIDRMAADALLDRCKKAYSGVARLGIEALEWKINGYSSADIARLYGVKPNHVGAWISRAAKKLRKDAAIRDFFPDMVENIEADP